MNSRCLLHEVDLQAVVEESIVVGALWVEAKHALRFVAVPGNRAERHVVFVEKRLHTVLLSLPSHILNDLVFSVPELIDLELALMPEEFFQTIDPYLNSVLDGRIFRLRTLLCFHRNVHAAGQVFWQLVRKWKNVLTLLDALLEGIRSAVALKEANAFVTHTLLILEVDRWC